MKKCFKNFRFCGRSNAARKCREESGLFLKLYLTCVNSAILAIVAGALLVFHSKELNQEDEGRGGELLNLVRIIHDILSSNFKGAPFTWLQYLALLTTCLAGILSFLGCCGACSESICFIGFHGILSILFLIFEAILSVLFITYKNELWVSTTTALQHSIRFVYNSSSSHPSVVSTTKSWDLLQIKYNCCGMLSPKDYKFSSWFNSTKDVEAYFVPDSCCINFYDPPNGPSSPPVSFPSPSSLSSSSSSSFASSSSSSSSSESENMCQIDAILFPRFKGYRRSFLRRKGCSVIFEEILLKCQPLAIVVVPVILAIHGVNSFVSFWLIRWLRKKFGDASSYFDEDRNEDS